MDNVKAIRVGDKLIIFINGKRQVVSKGVSPETFDRVCEFMNNNDTESIISIFDDFEGKITQYLQGYFRIENGLVFLSGKDKVHSFSKLIVRKASEFMTLKESPLFIQKMANKIRHVSNGVELGVKIFSDMENIVLTKNGNFVIKTYIDLRKNKVIGSPIDFNNEGVREGRRNDYSIPVITKLKKEFLEEREIETNNVLISPFDIISFGEGEIHVSRYKVINDFQIEKNGLVEMPKEDLYDISYQLYLEKFEKK